MVEIDVPADLASWLEGAWHLRKTATCARPVSVGMVHDETVDIREYAERSVVDGLVRAAAQSRQTALSLPQVTWSYVTRGNGVGPGEWDAMIVQDRQPWEVSWQYGDLDSLPSNVWLILCRASTVVVPPLVLAD